MLFGLMIRIMRNSISSFFFKLFVISSKFIRAYPRTSEADGQNSNEMFILLTDIRKDDLGISKIMKISLPNLNDLDFRS